ncbi:MAG: hypothetical protein JNK71_00845 [Methyloversatilis sp.]|nr:hypothetical protein [Methyloversatilis sp.]
MNPVLVKKLVSRYPLFLREIKALAEHEWYSRFRDCGDGWFDLVDQACTGVEAECLYALKIREAPVANIPHLKCATQKSWELRLHVGMSTDHSTRLGNIVRKESLFICERCGAPTSHHQTCWTTLCEWCLRLAGATGRRR